MVLGAVLLLAAGAIVILVLWTGVSATNVTFVNDTTREITLPDCSTDISTIPAGRPVNLPIAWDHPEKCAVDDEASGVVIGCVAVPKRLTSGVTIRISETRRC